jgi:ACS family allantoate permease-like MFS transporter
VIAWGGVLACFAAVKSFGGAVAIRFFLGLCESAVTPGFALITSQWYTKKEQGFRTGIWFSFNGWAQIFGGLLAYGIARGVDIHGAAIAGWQIIFLVVGLLTVVIGIIFLFTVPDNQMNARFLKKEDRLLAIERIRINQQGVGNKVCDKRKYRSFGRLIEASHHSTLSGTSSARPSQIH